MDLSKLKITTPLGNENVREGEYCHVSFYNYLRLTAFSDIPVVIEISFSHDGGTTLGPITVLKQTNFWSTRRIDIVLDWMKIRIIRDGPGCNNMLVVNVLGRRNNENTPQIPLPIVETIHKVKDMIIPSEPISEPIEQNESVEPVEPEPEHIELRSKSPFSSIFKRSGKKNNDIKKSVSWERLPAFIPKNGLLIGQFSNNICVVPPPDKDSTCYLAYKNGIIQWIEMECEPWKI